MANLKSLTVDGTLVKKSAAGTRAAVTTTDDAVKIGGNDDWLDAGNSENCVVTTCYHRAKNRIVAFFFDGSSQDAYGVAAAPTADGEDIDWGVYGGASNIGYVMTDNHSGNACSYDREKEKILWAGSGHSPDRIYSRVIDLDSTHNSNTRSITYGAAATWAMPGLLTMCIGPQAMIYVGDDAGSSAGKHVLLYSHSANNLRAVVGTIGSGNTVDWNTPLTNYAVFGTTTGGGANYEAGGCKVADNKIAVYWTDGSSEAWCRVGTVASGLITFGTKVQLSTLNISSSMGPSGTSICYDIVSGKVVFAWWVDEEGTGQKLRARIGTVTGTGITLGTVYDVIGYGNHDHGKVSLVYDENAQRTVIYYKRFAENDGSNDITRLFARAATIVSGIITAQENVNGTIVLTSALHGLSVNDPITFVATTGTNLGGNALLPGGLTAGTTYYIQVGEATVYRGINGVENNFCLSTSSGGSKISWTSGFQGTVSSPGHTYGGTDIAFGTEKLVEAPAGGKSFQRGPNTAFSYGCCSTYMSHADVKKTVVIRPGDGGSAFTGGGYAKATVTNLNVSTLTVDLSTGNAFELDMDDIVLHQGTIGTFTITESIGSGKTQAFTLKVTQGAVARDFNWSTITNVKWPGSTPPAAMSTTNNAVDIYSFTTYDQGTTWYGRVVGQNFI